MNLPATSNQGLSRRAAFDMLRLMWKLAWKAAGVAPPHYIFRMLLIYLVSNQVVPAQLELAMQRRKIVSIYRQRYNARLHRFSLRAFLPHLF